MEVFIHDTTRQDSIKSILSKKKVSSYFFLESESVDAPNAMILIHITNLTPEIRTYYPKAAKAGATVVLYSDGGGIDEKEEVIGEGRVMTIRWNTLSDVLIRLPQSFNLNDFSTALDAFRQRHLLNGLAILSWCASFPSDRPEIADAQTMWKSSRDKWLRVFSVCTEDDLLIACGGYAKGQFPEDMSEVEKFINWLSLPTTCVQSEVQPPKPPEFELVLKQIKQKFGLSI